VTISRYSSRQQKVVQRGKSILWFSTSQAWPTGRGDICSSKSMPSVTNIQKDKTRTLLPFPYVSTIMFIFSLKSETADPTVIQIGLKRVEKKG